MSEDVNKTIKQIADVLGQENLAENLMGLLNMLAGSTGKEEPKTPALSSPEPQEDKVERANQDDSLYSINKLRNMMERINVQNDPRVNLLNAIRPFLGTRRQKNLNNCVRLIQVSSLTRLLDDEKGGFFKGE